MKYVRPLILGVVVLLALGSMHTALADAAPPPPPPGTSLEPGESATMVRMIWEDVVMTVSDDSALVEAVFRLQNQSTETESFDVLFPLCSNMQYCDQNSPITDLAVRVDSVPTETKTIEEANDAGNASILWATWPMSFRPSAVVEVEVKYSVPAYHGQGIAALDHYSYILETGAGWYGTIREGKITVRVPYTASEDTVCITTDCAYETFPPGYTISGGDVMWQFTDLEPTRQNNIGVTVLDPPLYRSLVTARSQMLANPDSLYADLYLARLLSSAVTVECPGLHDYGCSYVLGPTAKLIPEAVLTYQHTLDLDPNNADLQAEYLEFLLAVTPSPYAQDTANVFVSRLKSALAIDPNNSRLLKIRNLFEEIDIWSSAAPNPSPAPAITPAASPMLALPEATITLAQPETSATPVVTEVKATERVFTPTAGYTTTPMPPIVIEGIPLKWIVLPVLVLVFTVTLVGLISHYQETE